MSDVVSVYLETVLEPQLRAFGADERVRRICKADVERRLRSVVTRWHEEDFRRTLLFLGAEEAAFYKPATKDPEVRALVVVCIRNSMLEDIASTREAAETVGAAGRLIDDDDMPFLTGD